MKGDKAASWESRRRALEDSFFAERDRQLLDNLSSELRHMEDQRQLAHVSSIANEKVLKELMACGIRAETLAAVRLIPLVEVAWCDGDVAEEERDAILRAAAANGIQPASACYQLLAHWLERRPDRRIIDVWKEYVGELTKVMAPEALAPFRQEILGHLTGIAKAAGGFMGVHTISHQEQQTIDDLAKASQPD